MHSIISWMTILDRWGIHNEVCSLCKQENETRSHLLIKELGFYQVLLQLVTLTFLLMGCQIMNQFAHSGQLSGSEANSNLQHQSSCNLPNNKDGAVSHFMKFQASKYTELQRCTSSGPGEKCTGEKAWGLTLLIKAKMVKFLLKIAADLQNLTNLQPQGGCDDPSFSYLFKVSFSLLTLILFA
ncbi:hypothetical protein Gotri_009361 [Gossypium trilobum]|uniref:Uncharacterized protein n=1 Tax=Gossypium trilobum TaxID=34281 RepID=A0A7J9EM76_9ROSI|nr:hypothetical protein [Gossypium trilobum]